MSELDRGLGRERGIEPALAGQHVVGVDDTACVVPTKTHPGERVGEHGPVEALGERKDTSFRLFGVGAGKRPRAADNKPAQAAIERGFELLHGSLVGAEQAWEYRD